MCGNTKPTDPLYMSSQSFGVDGNGKGTIIKSTATNSKWYYVFSVRDTAEIGSAVNMTAHPQVVDLTAMFGSQVADYIYSLEQAEAGKGVAFFKSLFPNDYYPYNAGELLSVEGLQSHDTVGFNQWDEEWELGTISTSSGNNLPIATRIRAKNYIRVLPNTTYYFKGTRNDALIYYYDINKGYASYKVLASDGTFTTPSNCAYIRFIVLDTTYNNDICINLSWSGWRNGEYEPYKKHSYPLDSSLTLRGFLKLNAQNELYFDGDIYSYNGAVGRRIGLMHIDENSNIVKDGVKFYVANDNIRRETVTYEGNMLCDSLPTIRRYTDLVQGVSGVCGFAGNGYSGKNWLYFSNGSATTVDEIKSWLANNPLNIIYFLATPTEETAEPYTSPQAVDDFGTEEYISGNVVPVGHNTQYPANLRDKLQHLPNLADNDGYYMISQQNKQMSLEVFRIPKAPTTDGTYTLKATVSGGTPTYIWEAVE